MTKFTEIELDLLYEILSSHLDERMNGNWESVRRDVGQLHLLISKIIALQENAS